MKDFFDCILEGLKDFLILMLVFVAIAFVVYIFMALMMWIASWMLLPLVAVMEFGVV